MSRSQIAAALPSLVIGAIAAAYVWISYDYDPSSRRLPWMAGVLAVLLALVDVLSRRGSAVTAAHRSDAKDAGKESHDRELRSAAAHSPWQEAIAFAWIGGFLPLVVVLGFYGAIPLYVFCYLRLYAGKGALVSAATAFGLVGCLYLVFEVFMGYALFGGLLGGDYL